MAAPLAATMPLQQIEWQKNLAHRLRKPRRLDPVHLSEKQERLGKRAVCSGHDDCQLYSCSLRRLVDTWVRLHSVGP